MREDTMPAACSTELLEASDGLAELVDRYVMIVTEYLCSLEKQNHGLLQQPEIVERKAYILEALDMLERLMASFRNTVALELPSVPFRRHDA